MFRFMFADRLYNPIMIQDEATQIAGLPRRPQEILEWLNPKSKDCIALKIAA